MLELIRPGDSACAAELAAFNRAVEHRPAAVVAARGAEDVVAAVQHAAARGLPVAVQATGHGAVMAAEGAMFVSTRAMRGLAVDPRARTAVVEAGLPWADVVAAAAAHGLAPLNGSAVTVGAIGYLTGGGLGPLSRAYGLGADHVRWLEVVTPDGRLRRVDPRREPELFWAVRGGKASFGIVTRAEIDLLPVARLYGGGLYYDGAVAGELLHAYREWLPTLPSSAHVAVALLRLPRAPHVPDALAERLVVHLRVAHLGSADEAERDLAPLRALAPTLLDTVREMPYAEVAAIHNEPREPMPTWGRGALLRDLPAAAADALLAAAGPQAGAPLTVVELRPLGGAVAARPERPSAVDGRDAAFNLSVLGRLDCAPGDAVVRAGERVVAALAPWDAGAALVNFLGAATAPAQVAAAWRPETYARLARLKRAVDPRHLFRFGHVVAPAAGRPV